MNGALELLSQFEKATLDGFPLGQEGAELLDQLERVTRLIDEAKSFYRAQLTKDPHCVPGWTLRPGSIRRSLGDPQACWERVQEVMTNKQFMAAVKVEVLRLQEQWSRAAGVPQSQAKEAFNQFMGGLLIEFPSAPSLVRTKI
jgi:hypothetical protein